MARVSTSVTVRDRGWIGIKAKVRELDGAAVKVGIRARDAGKMNDGVAVIDYAIWNEYGTATIPKRPYMRRTADTSEGALKAVTTKWAKMLVGGTMTVDQVLHSLGQYYKMRIQGTIRNASSWATPLAPSTIRQKGSTKILIDQGILISTIDYELER